VNYIDAWFFNEATKMNAKSGLQFAQLTRGIDLGRGIGIIDAKVYYLPPPFALTRLSPEASAKVWSVQHSLQCWVSTF
jgi:hypothetical protein